MKWLLAILLLATPAAYAEESSPVPQIQVSGEAKLSAVPDVATITAEAYAKDMQLEEAKKQHDNVLRNILALQKKYDLKDKQLSTQSARIQPHYRYNNNKRIFQGYSVSTRVSFELTDFDAVGAFLEDLVVVKSHSVNGPHYRIAEPKPLIDKARLLAVQDAKKKAEDIARELGIKVGPVLSVTDSHVHAPVVMRKQHMMRAEAADMAMSAAPVAPPAGEQDIRATINIRFELEN